MIEKVGKPALNNREELLELGQINGALFGDRVAHGTLFGG
jgi:hypothetical protein